jgi:hypothetical protein
MSAYFVTRQTIHDTVTAWARNWPQPRSQATLDSIGRSLWKTNAEALRQRYSLDCTSPENAAELAEYLRDASFYVYRHPRDVTPAQLAKSARCLRYQCCEGDVPETSDTYQFLDRLCETLGEPAGYDQAQWDRADAA